MPIDYEEEREVGAETVLTIAGTDTVQDVPISNVSYDSNVNTSTFQHNQDLHQANAITGVEYSGSFEHNGANSEVRQAIRDNEGKPVHPQNLTIRVQEYNRLVKFKRCVVESRSKDIPGDDTTSETYDFVAEKMIVEPGVESPKEVYGEPE
jgi:hypothetical protein